MEETMDYVYHHPEQPQSQAQLPYSQQRSRCPYFNRAEHHQQLSAISPHRPTPHYDPVHASANYWQSQAQLPPYHWQPQMLGHRGPTAPHHRPSNSASEPPYFNHGPASSFGNALGGYPGAPSHETGGLQPNYSSFPLPQLPPVRYGHPTPTAANQAATSQPSYVPERSFGHASGPRNGAFSTISPALNPPTQPATSQATSEPSAESTPAPPPAASESSVTSSQASNPSVNIQFGSAPPSAAPQRNNPAFSLSPYRSHRSTPSGTSSSGPSSSTNLAPHHPPTEQRRRVPATARRTMSRRQTPPSDREYDHEGEMRMLEHFVLTTGSRLMGHDVDDNHVRAAQFLRGSVSTKNVASSTAIQSLQSVAISDLSESERTCVICYNEFGVETPEGVNEAPLRLPKCKHVFGDHCIKKWFEESDSCPYCRDKVPSEPRITSTNPTFNTFFRARGQANLGGYAGFMREREATLGQDDSSRISAAGSSHGERRSPPTDSSEGRRRIRPRHGSVRGPGSPPFAGTRPGSFGGSSSTNHESARRTHVSAASRTYSTNTPARSGHNATSQVPFSVGSINQYHMPSFGAPTDASNSAAPTMPPYVPPTMHNGASHGGPGTGYSNPMNRNSLPAPPPSNWHSGNQSAADELHRRIMPNDSNAQLQANGHSQWGAQ
ncbi:hypothetical protein EsH8_I_000730 [Colletotrichum jinshuiense]